MTDDQERWRDSRSLDLRLKSWRAVLRYGGPKWIVEHAPKAIAEIEAMIAAKDSAHD